jgi:hypothetical protein
VINIVDLGLGALILFYLLKNAGSLLRTVRNLILVALFLVLFGMAAQVLLDMPAASATHRYLGESYFVKLSRLLIKWAYPAVKNAAPKVDNFINKSIIALPTPKDVLPGKLISKEVIPKLGN